MTQVDILKLAYEAALERWDKAYERLQYDPADQRRKDKYAEARNLVDEVRAMLCAEQAKEGKK